MGLVVRALLLSCGALLAADASAASRIAPSVLPAVPVEILLLGPDPVRIALSEGQTLPCDSPDNRPLLHGRFGGGLVRTTTTSECVCLQQTYAPFADIDWSNGVVACRPLRCGGRGRPCVAAPDPTIRVRVASRRSN